MTNTREELIEHNDLLESLKKKEKEFETVANTSDMRKKKIYLHHMALLKMQVSIESSLFYYGDYAEICLMNDDEINDLRNDRIAKAVIAIRQLEKNLAILKFHEQSLISLNRTKDLPELEQIQIDIVNTTRNIKSFEYDIIALSGNDMTLVRKKLLGDTKASGVNELMKYEYNVPVSKTEKILYDIALDDEKFLKYSEYLLQYQKAMDLIGQHDDMAVGLGQILLEDINKKCLELTNNKKGYNLLKDNSCYSAYFHITTINMINNIQEQKRLGKTRIK